MLNDLYGFQCQFSTPPMFLMKKRNFHPILRVTRLQQMRGERRLSGLIFEESINMLFQPDLKLATSLPLIDCIAITTRDFVDTTKLIFRNRILWYD